MIVTLDAHDELLNCVVKCILKRAGRFPGTLVHLRDPLRDEVLAGIPDRGVCQRELRDDFSGLSVNDVRLDLGRGGQDNLVLVSGRKPDAVPFQMTRAYTSA